ncbi:hypothetical protein FQN60_002210, partial [Etheostoma spectabile]
DCGGDRPREVEGCLCGALPGAGDVLPPQRGEVSLLAGGGEGFGLGAAGLSLGLQLGHLKPDGGATTGGVPVVQRPLRDLWDQNRAQDFHHNSSSPAFSILVAFTMSFSPLFSSKRARSMQA